MGKLFFTLDEIDIDKSDMYFLTQLEKYCQSNMDEEIHDSMKMYDLSKLSESKLSIFVNTAKRIFVHGKNKMNISFLPEANFYTIDQISNGQVGEG